MRLRVAAEEDRHNLTVASRIEAEPRGWTCNSDVGEHGYSVAPSTSRFGAVTLQKLWQLDAFAVSKRHPHLLLTVSIARFSVSASGDEISAKATKKYTNTARFLHRVGERRSCYRLSGQ
jgi:hypothetical protein